MALVRLLNQLLYPKFHYFNITLISVIGSEDSEKDRKELHKLFKANQNDTGQVKEKVLRLTVWVGLSEQSFKPNDKIQIKSIKKAEIFQKTMLQGQVNHIKDIKRLN